MRLTDLKCWRDLEAGNIRKAQRVRKDLENVRFVQGLGKPGRTYEGEEHRDRNCVCLFLH